MRSAPIMTHYVNPGQVLEIKRLMDEQALRQDKPFFFQLKKEKLGLKINMIFLTVPLYRIM